MNSIYSTILSSNGADGKTLVKDWVEKMKFSGVNIIINDDLSINIRGIEGFRPWADQSIILTSLPPFGIHEIRDCHVLTFKNTKIDPIKLPKIYRWCTVVTFENCEVPESLKDYSYTNHGWEDVRKFNFTNCNFI